MKVTEQSKNGQKVIIIEADTVLIKDSQSALDLLLSLAYEYQTNKIILLKSVITEDFFELRTKIAGDILQKCTNYHIELAVAGDYSSYTSKALKEFIYESNQSGVCFFVDTPEKGLDLLTKSGK
ncbi:MULTISPECIES: DUF4180 domain-containing protein [unclassified Enterococcus]|jgi:hypothetical protein|uniref:DUF4180 domain-containing protein n=1 Tax=unclassified Enterococcus TaxID=2608891 RepID=UPI003D29E042